eukprot:scaffold671337_cov50-Prasinocladus_malaysianus.AAC.1
MIPLSTTQGKEGETPGRGTDLPPGPDKANLHLQAALSEHSRALHLPPDSREGGAVLPGACLSLVVATAQVVDNLTTIPPQMESTAIYDFKAPTPRAPEALKALVEKSGDAMLEEICTDNTMVIDIENHQAAALVEPAYAFMAQNNLAPDEALQVQNIDRHEAAR